MKKVILSLFVVFNYLLSYSQNCDIKTINDTIINYGNSIELFIVNNNYTAEDTFKWSNGKEGLVNSVSPINNTTYTVTYTSYSCNVVDTVVVYINGFLNTEDSIFTSTWAEQCAENITVNVIDYAYPIDSGYINGNNYFGDLEKGMIYKQSDIITVNSVIAFIPVKINSSNSDVYAKIYNLNSTTMLPTGTAISTSKAVKMADIDTTSYTIFEFNPPIKVTTNFAITITIPDNSQGDLIAITSTQPGCNSGDTLAIEKWSDNTWVNVNNNITWGANFDFALFPVISKEIHCTANAGADVTVNSGSATTISATGGATYQWSNGGTNNTFTIFPTENVTYIVTITTNDGCKATDNIVVNVKTSPISANAGLDKTICEGDIIVLTAQGGDIYSWSNGGTSESIAVQPTQTTTYKVTVKSGANSATDDVVVFVSTIPVISAGFDKTICNGESVSISAIGGSEYLWNNGVKASIINVSPTSNSTYKVTGKNTGGCSNTDEVVIIAKSFSKVNLGNDTILFSGSSLTLDCKFSGTYSWSNGSTSKSITVSPTSTTKYSVTITNNGCTSSDEIAVDVSSSNNVYAGSDKTICEGDSVIIMAVGTDTYSWLETGETVAAFYVKPTITTTYTVTGSTTGGVNSTDNVVVNVLGKPIVDVTTDTSMCAGLSLTFDLSNINYTYKWNTGETNGLVTFYPVANTQYSVTVYSKDNCKNVRNINVSVSTAPTANAGNDATIASGETITLTATGGTSYEWSNGGNTQSIGVSPLVTTIYTVTVYKDYCYATDEVEVYLNSTPSANAGADVTVCNGSSATLSASGGTGYSWSTNETTKSITVTPTENTTYRVTVSSSSFTDTDEVIVYIGNEMTVYAGENKTICRGNKTTLSTSIGTSYKWSNLETMPTIEVSPTTSTQYIVTVYNGTCSGTDEVIVFVDKPISVKITQTAPVCEGGKVILMASGASKYQWSNGETNSYTEITPVSSSIITVTGTKGACEATNETTVDIVTEIPATLTESHSICIGSSTTLVAGGGTNYKWSTGESASSIKVKPIQTTAYIVTISSGICSEIKQVLVNVDSVISIDAGENITMCKGDSAMLNATGNNSVKWNTGSVGNTIKVKPDYTSVYIVTAQSGNCVATDKVIVYIKPSLETKVTSDMTICQYNETKLKVTVSVFYKDSVKFTWNTGDTTSEIIIQPDTSMIYKVSVKSKECIAEKGINITVLEGVKADFDFFIDSTDFLTVEFFDNSIGNVDSYYWDFGTNDSSDVASIPNTTFKYKDFNYYNPELTVKAANGCTSTKTKNVGAVRTSINNVVSNSTAKIDVYPIPAISNINIKATNNKITGIKLMDILGKVLLEKELTPTYYHKLNVSNYTPGLYLLKMTTEKGEPITKRIEIK
ncbi:MAG: hypothetical protein A2X02_04450 [Bacteroidetes bacterium GWF2_29_10]|nr:MAG: hypothetical protein A2X02_04450 [Bacteroidetes bacterium GWF2_29_10]